MKMLTSSHFEAPSLQKALSQLSRPGQAHGQISEGVTND